MMMKRVFIATFLFVMHDMPCAAAFYEYGDFKYWIDQNRQTGEMSAMVAYYIGSSADVTLPASIVYEYDEGASCYNEDTGQYEWGTFHRVKTLPVTGYYNYWLDFSSDKNLRTLTINAPVDKSPYCLKCYNLQRVVLPDSITTIVGSSFSQCTNLMVVNIPQSVTEIGDRAFYMCEKLTALQIPDGITTIQPKTFEGCKNLTSISIPSSVTYIGGSAFRGCESLQEVVLPYGLLELHGGAFYGCTSLRAIEIPPLVKDMKGRSGYEMYMYYAFESCTNLTSAIFRPSHSRLPEALFRNCTSLKRVEIPSSVEDIPRSAFAYCSSLEDITFEENETYKMDGEFLIRKADNTLITVCVGAKASVEIPNCITSISDYAFSGRKSEYVTIPYSATDIGYRAFHHCENLKRVIIPNNEVSMSEVVFSCCTRLNEINLPDKMTSIGGEFFENCESLSSIHLPTNVSTIYTKAFAGCRALQDVVIPESVDGIYETAFQNCSGLSSVVFLGRPPEVISVSSSGGYIFTHLSTTIKEREGNYIVLRNIHSPSLAKGYYQSKYSAEWASVLDDEGYWHGIKMEERKDAYSVIYDANGGIGVVDDQHGEIGGAGIVVNDGGSLHWEGHYFMGWALAPDGEVAYRAGDYVAEPTDGNTVTLYAVWSQSALTITPVDADWRAGSISFKCEDADTSGAHTYRLAWYNQVDGAWVLAGGDAATNVQLGSDGYAHLSDTKFASRNNGAGAVKYRVMDENGRTSAECVTRNRHGLFAAINNYQDGWAGNLTTPHHEMAVFRDTYKRYAGVDKNLRTMTDQEVTKDGIITGIYGFANHPVAGDIVVFYFCGHGLNGGLACYDKERIVWGHELADAFKKFQSGVAVVAMLYSCYSGSVLDVSSLGNNVAWIYSSAADEKSKSGMFTDVVCYKGWMDGLADDKSANSLADGDGYITFAELAEYGQQEMGSNFETCGRIMGYQNSIVLDNIVLSKVPGQNKANKRFRWFTQSTESFAASEGDIEVAAATTAANGIHTIGDCYELGIDPDDPNDDLKITDFKMDGGKPVITLNHTENGSGESFLPRIKTLGKTNLADPAEEWLEVPKDGDSTMRFFKVEVEMP